MMRQRKTNFFNPPGFLEGELPLNPFDLKLFPHRNIYCTVNKKKV
jgi:hypothetical protein